MIRPEDFRKTADEALGGLTAGPALLNRARMLAAAGRQPQPVRPARRALAMALSLALVIGLTAFALPRLNQPRIPVLETKQAGPEALSGLRTTADLPRGSLSLSREASPGYLGVWEKGAGANFPLLRVEGRYYRLLSHPADVSGLTGGSLGQVSLFTDEPALDNTNQILSNIAAQDAAVYAVSGMGKAAAAAQVNGQVRLFQRVSFAGTALLGGEGLADTLPRGAVGLQLSDVGTITDPNEVSRLMDILYSRAAYQGSQSRSGSQALLVQYASGVVLQLAVSGESLSACGTWSCPEFIEAFSGAAGK